MPATEAVAATLTWLHPIHPLKADDEAMARAQLCTRSRLSHMRGRIFLLRSTCFLSPKKTALLLEGSKQGRVRSLCFPPCDQAKARDEYLALSSPVPCALPSQEGAHRARERVVWGGRERTRGAATSTRSVVVAQPLQHGAKYRQHRFEHLPVGVPAIHRLSMDALGDLGVAGRADVILGPRVFGEARHGRGVGDIEKLAEPCDVIVETFHHRFVAPFQYARREHLQVVIPLLEGLYIAFCESLQR